MCHSSGVSTATTLTPLKTASRALPPLLEDRLDHRLRGLVEVEVALPAVLPARELDLAGREALRPDREAPGDPDQLGVRELHAGPLVAVVEQDVDARLPELLVEALPCLRRGDVLRVQHCDHELEGSHVQRPDDSLLVVVPLHDRREAATDPDAVGAHDDRDGLAGLVEHGCAELLAVAGAELEDVADLDRLPHLERCLAERAGLAFLHLAQIEPRGDLDVTLDVDAAHVEVVLVGARHQVAPAAERRIHEDLAAAHADCAEAPRARAERRADLLRARGPEPARARGSRQTLIAKAVV